jgi:hypothetical protein
MTPIQRNASCCEKHETGSSGNNSNTTFARFCVCSAHGSIHFHSVRVLPHLSPHYLLNSVISHEQDIFFLNLKYSYL